MPEFVANPLSYTIEDVKEYLENPEWSQEEYQEVRSSVMNVPAVEEASEALRENMSEEKAVKVEKYALAWVPKIYRDYLMDTAIKFGADFGLNKEDSPSVQQVVNRLENVTSVEEGKDVIDDLRENKFGLADYTGVLNPLGFSTLSPTLEEEAGPGLPVTPAGILDNVPAPPGRIGIPSTKETVGRPITGDMTNIDSATIAPVKNIIAGPILSLGAVNLPMEIQFSGAAGQKGIAASIVLMFWRCWFMSAWIPMIAGLEKFRGSTLQKFQVFGKMPVSMGEIQGAMVVPLGKNVSEATVRKTS